MDCKESLEKGIEGDWTPSEGRCGFEADPFRAPKVGVDSKGGVCERGTGGGGISRESGIDD